MTRSYVDDLLLRIRRAQAERVALAKRLAIKNAEVEALYAEYYARIAADGSALRDVELAS